MICCTKALTPSSSGTTLSSSATARRPESRAPPSCSRVTRCLSLFCKCAHCRTGRLCKRAADNNRAAHGRDRAGPRGTLSDQTGEEHSQTRGSRAAHQCAWCTSSRTAGQSSPGGSGAAAPRAHTARPLRARLRHGPRCSGAGGRAAAGGARQSIRFGLHGWRMAATPRSRPLRGCRRGLAARSRRRRRRRGAKRGQGRTNSRLPRWSSPQTLGSTPHAPA
jgi:hypothetical protein